VRSLPCQTTNQYLNCIQSFGKGEDVISGLHHYALEVPDLEVAEGFLQDFGLETGEKNGNIGHLLSTWQTVCSLVPWPQDSRPRCVCS
jgi:hypothetical protein